MIGLGAPAHLGVDESTAAPQNSMHVLASCFTVLGVLEREQSVLALKSFVDRNENVHVQL